MFKLDNAFLEELGLGSLPPVEKNKMLAHIYETLEMRVGMKLAEQMSNDQLDEFESYINAQDEPGALKWLESNFPNYKDVVAQELEKLKGEISQVAPQILAQSQENAAQNQLPDQPQQSQPVSSQQPVAQPQPAQQQQPTVQPMQSQPQQPSSEPQTNTSGVNYVPNGTSQGSTAGQQPQTQEAQPAPEPQPPLPAGGLSPQSDSAPAQPWQPE